MRDTYVDAVVYMSCTEFPCYKACKAEVNSIIGNVANVSSYNSQV